MYMLKFAKIDLLKTRSFSWLLLFPVLAVCMLSFSNDGGPTMAITYCQFAGIIASALPFATETREECGFLQMLPCHPGDDLRGHFLYGFLAELVATFLGCCALLVSGLLRPELGLGPVALYPVLFGITLLLIVVQNMLLTFFRSENAQVMQLMRMVPSFAFFFGTAALMEHLPDLVGRFLGWLTLIRGFGIAAVCCVLYGLLTQLCVMLTQRKDLL